jgi:hypothetical protein
MTLIITVVTPNKVIQASDRRLTNRDGSLYDDEANKAVCVSCKDAHFAIAYTGIGEIAGRRTDRWLVDYLTSIKAYQMDVPSVSNALKNEATACFKSVHIETTFVLAGYRCEMPFVALISNFESHEPASAGEARDNFQTHVRQVRGPISSLKRGLWIYINGCKPAVDKPIMRRVRKLARKRFFHHEEESVIAAKLVFFIRAASNTLNFGRFIGRNCMTVIIHPKHHFITKYHAEKDTPTEYMPHLITGNKELGIAFRDIEIWNEEPPWW